MERGTALQHEPLVCCVMLVDGRAAMVRRAIKCFRQQTYTPRMLLMWDTTETWDKSHGDIFDTDISDVPETPTQPRGYLLWIGNVTDQRKTIGELRNEANRHAIEEMGADIICTLDSDDWSHPNRIAEQVALLQASGADAVGYSDLLFWDTRERLINPELHDMDSVEPANQAWLYSRPTRLNVPGTTLCYWRKAWERKPFPHLPGVGNPTSQGEDIVWQAGLNVEAVSSFCETAGVAPPHGPRMIASVHSGNTMAAGYSHMGRVEEFVRTPEWDSYCARVMEIK